MYVTYGDGPHIGMLGNTGRNWSSTASTNHFGSFGYTAYFLGFDSSLVGSSTGPNVRWFDIPLRCQNSVLVNLTIFKKIVRFYITIN